VLTSGRQALGGSTLPTSVDARPGLPVGMPSWIELREAVCAKRFAQIGRV